MLARKFLWCIFHRNFSFALAAAILFFRYGFCHFSISFISLVCIEQSIHRTTPPPHTHTHSLTQIDNMTFFCLACTGAHGESSDHPNPWPHIQYFYRNICMSMLLYSTNRNIISQEEIKWKIRMIVSIQTLYNKMQFACFFPFALLLFLYPVATPFVHISLCRCDAWNWCM